MFINVADKTTTIMDAKEEFWEGTTMASTKTIPAESIGQRITRLRKERGITQEELSDYLGVSQPVVSDYERGELRVHGELIVKLAKFLKVSADELLGLNSMKEVGAPKNRRLLRRLQQLDRLPKRDQEAVIRTMDAFLQKV